MFLKILIVLTLFAIIYCLGSALYQLVRQDHDSMKLVKALTWRVALSISLFCLIMLTFFMGWITPHGTP